MDTAKQQAIQACGRCKLPEEAHKNPAGADQDGLAIFAALGGACTQFVVSDAAVIILKHLAITNNRAPGRRPDGGIGKRLPVHKPCGNRHQPGSCPLGVVPPADATAATVRGAAKVREALGLTQRSAEAS